MVSNHCRVPPHRFPATIACAGVQARPPSYLPLLPVWTPKRSTPYKALMRFIIHAGPQKTGTTYLQNVLFGMQEALASSGIHYGTSVDDFSVRRSRRSDMGEALMQTTVPDITRYFAAIRARGTQTLVISSELLSHLSTQQLAPLREAVGDSDVQVVFYCRRWSDRLPSLWAERVSTGTSVPFSDWYLRSLNKADELSYVDETMLWNQWADLFGRTAVRIVSYDVLQQEKADIAQDFLSRIVGWNGTIDTTTRSVASNPRLAPMEIELSRAMNAMAKSRGERVSKKSRLKVIRRLRRRGFEPFRTLLAGAKSTIEMDDSAAALAGPLARMQEWAGAALLPCGEDRRLVLPTVGRHEVYNPSWLVAPAANEALQAIYAKLEARPNPRAQATGIKE
jgi:hypothetical protein